MVEDLSVDIQERGFIDLIKETILQDKKRETEYTKLLKDDILYLKQEILQKNSIILNHLKPVLHRKINFQIQTIRKYLTAEYDNEFVNDSQCTQKYT